MGKHEDLHRLHDGELRDAEKGAVEAALDDDARARLAAMAEMGDLLRATFDAETEGFDVAPSVMARLAKKPSLMERARATLRSYRMVLIPALAAACVVAAIYLVPWRGGNIITDNCDIESLEVEGAAATVLKLHDDKS